MKRRYIIIILIFVLSALSAEEIIMRKNIIDAKRKLENYKVVLKSNQQRTSEKLPINKILEVLYIPDVTTIANIKSEKNGFVNIEIKMQDADKLTNEIKKAESIANFSKVEKIIIDNSKNGKNSISITFNFAK